MKILIVSMTEGEFAPMLAGRLNGLGVECHAVCSARHVLALSNAVVRRHVLQRRSEEVSIEAAIRAVAPDLVIPCDDAARLALNRLQARVAARTDAAACAVADVISVSSGDARHFAVIEKKSALVAALAGSSVITPRSRPVASAADVDAAIADLGLPVVIKKDGTCGGQGVVVCGTRAAALDAHLRLSADLAPDDRLSAQTFIRGRPANRIVFARDGRVVAGLSVVAEITHPPITGPACVVRITSHVGMTAAVDTIVARFGMSGVHGFDFVIDTATDEACFIEVNARATPSVHLGRTAASDICRAIAAFGGVRPPEPPTDSDTDEPIAIFPSELRRDPASALLAQGRAHVPWADPLVMAAFVGSQVQPAVPSRFWSLRYRLAQLALRLPAWGQRPRRMGHGEPLQPPPNR